MWTSSTLVVLATFGRLGFSSAIPAELQRRASGTPNDPKMVYINCAGAEAVCNADCLTILCFEGPNPVQYIQFNDNRGRDGNAEASLRVLLQRSESERRARGVDISDDVLNQNGRSPEETIMNLAEEGGQGEPIVPVHERENSALGGVVIRAIERAGVSNGQFFYKVFQNYGTLAPYCAALQRNPPDRSVCTRKGKPKTDPIWTTMVKYTDKGARGAWTWRMMDPDAGDLWTGHDWPGSFNGFKKREEEIKSIEQGEEERQPD
ncbi:MAG: hypothetical protein M1820_009417 [Bogoriella megaspora]|nr:MAG: hypothetical protein M1820_009417 [Bogoriella megaspora]